MKGNPKDLKQNGLTIAVSPFCLFQMIVPQVYDYSLS